MRFSVLGPLEAHEGARALKLGGGRERALLALLLMHAGEVVSRDRLVDELWHGAPPPGAARSVDAYVSRIRRSMRQAGGNSVLATQPPGWVIRPDELDAVEFETMARAGREALAAGDPERGARCLREALGLWRGAAYVEVADETWARPESGRLEDLRLAAVEERIDADLQLDAHDDLVPELELLLARHPTRERLVGQLMLALYRSGRQADALATYRAAREALVEELGLEPGPELRRLEAAVLAHDAALDLTRGHPADPSLDPPERERRDVTVLVAEVTGAVEARSRQRMVATLCAGVHRLAGVLDEVTDRGIVALFGASRGQDDHARRACYAALHLRHELGTRARIALAAGEVTVGPVCDGGPVEYAPVGDMLGLPRALEQIARPGTVYLADDAAPLAEGWSALGELAGATVPLPSRLQALPAGGYVGRVAERERVAAIWRCARDETCPRCDGACPTCPPPHRQIRRPSACSRVGPTSS